MGVVGKIAGEIGIQASAEKFHDVLGARPHHVSTVTPNKVKACKLHKGQWGQQNSVISWDYVLDGKHCVAKEIVEEIDDANCSVTLKLIEGDLMEEFKAFKLIEKATPISGSEGSIVKWTLEYEKLNETVADPTNLLEYVLHVSKEIGDHLAQA